MYQWFQRFSDIIVLVKQYYSEFVMKGQYKLNHHSELQEADFVVFPKRSYKRNFVMVQQEALLLLAHEAIPRQAVRLYLWILAHVDREGTMQPISQRRIGELLGLTQSTVWKAFSYLRENEFVSEVLVESHVEGGISQLRWKVNPDHVSRK